MFKIKIFTCVLSLVLLFASSLAYAQAGKKFILGMASISGGIETLYVTKKIGAFKRNGLDIDSDFAVRFILSRLGLDPTKD